MAVIGNGYVGTVTATCLARLGHRVVGLEARPDLAEQLASGQLRFYEPGLPELLAETLTSGRMQFTAVPRVALEDADVTFLCVGTPRGRGGAPDLSQVEEAALSIAAHLRDGALVVIKSTVPVGTGEWVRSLIEEFPRTQVVPFSVVSNPEFLRESHAIQDFLIPDRILVGGDRDGVDRLLDLYAPIIDQSFPGADPSRRPSVFTTDIRSAEMVKYAANAFLATKISFANEIANLCERVGADARQILPAVGADTRIASSFLNPGLGWGGSCLPKDIAALIATGEEYEYDSPLLRAAVRVNETQRASVMNKLKRELKTLRGKRVALLGLTFKPGTDDLRDAPSVDLIRRLLAAEVSVSAYDPMVKHIPDDGQVRISTDPYEAAAGAHAVVLVTEWPEFADLDFHALAEKMSGDLVLDGRNFLDAARLAEARLRVVGVGWVS